MDCVLCRSARVEKFLSLNGQYSLNRCLDCSLVRLDPIPSADQLSELYSSGGYYSEGGSGYSDYAGQRKSLTATYKKMIQRLKGSSLTAETVVLEVGSGLGYFLDAVKPHCRSVVGIELDQAAVSRMQERGLSATRESLEEFSSDERFDLIVAIQVLEHFPDPLSTVNKIRNLLTPGGKFVVVVPNFDSPLRRVLGRRWPSYKVPEHLTYFTPSTLRLLLASVGASAMEEIPYPHAFPLSLLLGYAGIRVPKRLQGLNVWIPTTCVAIVATFD